jgi:hypothetical protein
LKESYDPVERRMADYRRKERRLQSNAFLNDHFDAIAALITDVKRPEACYPKFSSLLIYFLI